MTTLRLRAARLPDLRHGGLWALRWAAFWTAIALVALMAGSYAQVGTLQTALAPAGLFAAWFACRTFPLAAVAGLLVLSGASASLFVFFSLPVQSMTEAMCAGIISAAAVAAISGRRGDAVRPWPGAVLLFTLVFAAIGWYLLADNVAAATRGLRGQWLFISVGLALAYAPWPAWRDRQIVTVGLSVALVLAGYGLFRWAFGAAPEEIEQHIATAGRYAVLDGSTDRVIGAIGDSHALASWMTAFVPFSLAIALAFGGRLRLLALAVCGAAFALVIGSEVRSGLASSVVGVSVVVGVAVSAHALGLRRILGVGLTVLVASSLGAGALLIDPEESRLADRFSAIFDPGNDPAFKERRFKWGNAIREVDDEPTGRGLGTASVRAQTTARFADLGTVGVDNSYLKIAYEQGLVMAVLFILAMLLILGALVSTAVRTRDRLTAAIATGAAGTTAAYGLHLNFEVTYIELPSSLGTWFVIGLGMRQVARKVL